MLQLGEMEDKRKQELFRQVEENLKRVYRSKAEEELPDRFIELLNQLREQEDKGDET